jgi:hypothetical protein
LRDLFFVKCAAGCHTPESAWALPQGFAAGQVSRTSKKSDERIAMTMHRKLMAAFGAVVLVLAACGGGGDGGSGTQTATAAGTLHVSLSDAPACGYDAVNITVQKLRVNMSATAGDSDAGWSEIALSPAMRLDLLSLTNGVFADLGQTPLPPGKYTQMRLVLADNDASNPLANSVVPSGRTETALTTPSGQQSGIKMNVDIDVAANQIADVVIDFDACRSLVSAGASGKYLLKPVVSVIPHFISGVSGNVDASLAGSTTGLSLQQGGQIVKSTVPDSSGHFLLQPVAPGTYDLVLTTPGHATAVVTNVVVTADTVTVLNGTTNTIKPAASASGTFSGVVTTGAAPVDATVSVTQALSIGHTVVLIDSPVDATTGAYVDVLATGAPVVAPYAAAPAALVFAPDSAVAGKFSLSATSNGATKSAGPLTLAAGTIVLTNFTFP